MKYRIFMLTAIFSVAVFACKTNREEQQNSLKQKVLPTINDESIRPFSGSVFIAKKGETLCEIVQGKANEDGEIITKEEQFVIGSLSKQITAVLILQAVERNELRLEDPVSKYLPEISQTWADSVTVYHLLNHTHGIVNVDEGLSFKLGSKFAYSNLGYDLLGKIVESASGQAYSVLSADLFKFCGMKSSIDPRISDKKGLLPAMFKTENGETKWVQSKFENAYIPAACLLSTAADLALWNEYLHNGKLLNERHYKMMTTPSAKQNHSLFGEVGYGFGLRISTNDKLLEYGHTGYDPGYISMNFYYPESQTSVIVLENLDWNAAEIKDTFSHELAIRKVVRTWILGN